jgi:RNA polymerase sigma factor (sigma-70 family)
MLLREGAGLTDGQLLADYVNRRNGEALAALVNRHAPMVWNVCRRVLGNHHDVEDAFQATFLVFVRKAASIAQAELLSNWLYGVARQTAMKARTMAAKRREREQQVENLLDSPAAGQDLGNDLRPLIDHELGLLPDRYRVVIVLCDLEGKTRQEAARCLGCPEGTVGSRLARARTLLAKRLARHGLAVSGGTLTAVLAQDAASASVPISVLSATIKAVTLVAAGTAVTGGTISATVAALEEGAVKAMFMHKLKTLTTLMLGALATIAIGAWLHTHLTAAQQTPTEQPFAGVETEAQAKQPAPKGAEHSKGAEKDVIKPGDRLQIHAANTLPDRPIKGVFRVEPGGTIALGVGYGRVEVKGLTPEEAEASVRRHLLVILKDAEVSITRYDLVSDERVQALEGRVRQLEEEIRNLRATVEGLQKQKGK